MHVASAPDGQMRLELRKPPAKQSGPFRPTAIMEMVSRALEDGAELSQRGIEAAVGRRAEHVRLAVELLVSDGFIERRKDGSSLRHTSRKPYRQPDDEGQEP